MPTYSSAGQFMIGSHGYGMPFMAAAAIILPRRSCSKDWERLPGVEELFVHPGGLRIHQNRLEVVLFSFLKIVFLIRNLNHLSRILMDILGLDYPTGGA
jgi:hypothetical protein